MKLNFRTLINLRNIKIYDETHKDLTNDDILVDRIFSNKALLFKMKRVGIPVNDIDRSMSSSFIYFMYLYILRIDKTKRIVNQSKLQITNNVLNFDWINNFFDKAYKKLCIKSELKFNY